MYLIYRSDIMSKSRKKNTKPVKSASDKKQEEKAANRRGIVIIAVIIALFTAFIVLIAIKGASGKDNSAPSTTLTPEQEFSQALEDFEV